MCKDRKFILLKDSSNSDYLISIPVDSIISIRQQDKNSSIVKYRTSGTCLLSFIVEQPVTHIHERILLL